jgi:hypothetical protein
MSEDVTVTSFCPASQIQARLSLANARFRGCLVAGKPVSCNMKTRCGKADSARCMLKAQRIETHKER